MTRLLLVLAMLGCTGGGDTSSELPDATPPDAGSTTMPPPDAAPPMWPPVAKVGGVIAIAERVAFCTELASCGGLTYGDCIAAVDHSATVQLAIPGCAAAARLEPAIACTKANGYCASSACDAVIEQWAQTYASAACEVEVASVGIGDRYDVVAGADSQCDGGVRAAGGWCTRACSTSQQCAGKGPGALNHFGTANVCAFEGFVGGFGCYPTCTSTAHCQAWFGELRDGARIACKQFDMGEAPEPICVRVTDDRGVELP